jgi:23S rRNA (cytosine1962-C5)-methyltransferase
MKNQIILKKNEEHRLAAGHLWIFSNEVASVRGTPESGSVVELLRADEKFLGIGFFNPHSLIAFRLLSTDREEITPRFFEKRIQRADALRQRFSPNATAYRMVYGESDFLPGLTIDRYNEYLSLQILSAGMETHLNVICDVLEDMFHPKAIVARNDVGARTLEQLPLEKKVLRGTVEKTIISEDDVKFSVDVLNGQKTGFFLDQRENRKAARRYVAGARVLDCFCNEGGFSVHAAKAGAKEIISVDSSEQALAHAATNTHLNQVENVSFVAGDAFDILQKFDTGNERFDVVILDPPSFTKSKKTIATALKGYKEIHMRAFGLIKPGGFLITASCSHHITEEAFLDVIQQSALKRNRKIQMLEFRGAGPDHPNHPAMPETRYLKFAIFSVL